MRHMNYISVKDASIKFKISERRVQKLCEEGRIPGVTMLSGVWLIPENSEKPLDERTIQLQADYISLKDLCVSLSISEATGRNWLKLEKIIPQKTINHKPYFSKEYLTTVKETIGSLSDNRLKSRRNKSAVSGHSMYENYVSSDSKNQKIISDLLKKISDEKIIVTRSLLFLLAADCSLKLLNEKTKNNNIGNIYSYCLQNNAKCEYYFLIDDLLAKIDEDIITCAQKYKALFDTSYYYEEKEDVLGLLYLSLSNIGKRKSAGAYYTPSKIARKLCDQLFNDNSKKEITVLDPGSGTGNFMLQLPNFIHYQNVYCTDIDELSVLLARINYALKYEIYDKKTIYTHVYMHNYLKDNINMKYDYIIGNPPWGYDFSANELSLLKSKYNCAKGRCIESYDVFIEESLRRINNGGTISFVLPEAIINVNSHTPIRKILTAVASITYIEYLGNVFDKVQCPCVLLSVKYTGKQFSYIGTKVKTSQNEYVIKKERKLDINQMSFLSTDEEYDILQKIVSFKKIAHLKDNAIFALGIVTGDNARFISKSKLDGYEQILKGSNIEKYTIIPSNNYIRFQPNLFQQVAPKEYYRAKEKLLYRFISESLIFAYDDKQTLSLNSCNILIPKIDGLSTKYILAILNSSVAQFYFKKSFNSIKVLRSHIESIPIPIVDMDVQNRIIGFVNKLINDVPNKSEIYLKLDKIISELYGLTPFEHATYL